MNDLDLEFSALTGGLLEEEEQEEYLSPVEEKDDDWEEEKEDDRFEPYICLYAESVKYLQRGDIRRMMDECLVQDRSDLAHYVLEHHPGFAHDLRHWLNEEEEESEDDRSDTEFPSNIFEKHIVFFAESMEHLDRHNVTDLMADFDGTEEDGFKEDLAKYIYDRRPDLLEVLSPFLPEEEDDRSEEEDIDPSFVAAIETIVKSVPSSVAAMSIEPLLKNKGYRETAKMITLITGGADVLSVLSGHNPLEEELEEAIESFSPALKELMQEKWEAIVSLLFSSSPPKKASPPKKRKPSKQPSTRSSGEGSAKSQLLQLMRDQRVARTGQEWATIAVSRFGRAESTYTVQLSALKREGQIVQEGTTPTGAARYRAK